MNNTVSFIFNGQTYYVGTIVQVKEEWKQNFKFSSILKFTGYNIDEHVYCFTTLQDIWTIYKLSEEQIQLYISHILQYGENKIESNEIDPKYIDNIVSAWIWYIFLMGITLIFNGSLAYWTVISIIFFMHRNKKLKEAGYKE